ncbi:MAG: efflux RND transporter periplasmic adaptor subunit [Bacteroidia bacterium]|nr:efflux RND transporter periplasmic adaptor subunit [Bacteroidia bacterium]
MKSVYLILSSLLILAINPGCGEKVPQTLEEKKAALTEKKQLLKDLSREVTQLEEEVAKLDPVMRAEARKAPVSTLSVTTSDFKHYVEVQGQVEANKNVLVSPQTPGTIIKINVKEGQSVSAGTVLAQIDDAIMRSGIQEMETSLELANIMFNKQKNLWEQQIGTEVQYLTAKNQKEALERRIETMKEQLELSKIKSPISGTVDEIMPKVGETVSPGFPAFRVINPNDLSLKAQLSESYIPYIKRGDLVKITFPALEKTIDAKVTVVGQFINPNDRTFPIEVQLPNNPMLKANMFGAMSINDRTLKSVVTIPTSVIQQSEESDYVFIASEKEGKWIATRTNIKTGLSYNGQVEVIEGLSTGQQLVVMGYKNLSDGQEIIINETQALAGTK